MTHCHEYEAANKVKENMAHIYDRADPRAYFQELKSVDYKIPGEAKPIFQDLIACLRADRKDTIRVLDLGCSYGINAALLKYDLSIEDLYAHWGEQRITSKTPDEVITEDKRFFSDVGEVEGLEIIGLDVADKAVEFAEETGLLDEGLTLNLEKNPLPLAARQELASTDLVTSTGCVGYVSETSFDRLLPAVTQKRPAWFANFVLRMFPFEAIEATLEDRGYVTEKLEGQTFIQREFSSAAERDQVLQTLRERGLDPEGLESEGHLVAEFFLSRPREDAAKLTIDEVISTN